MLEHTLLWKMLEHTLHGNLEENEAWCWERGSLRVGSRDSQKQTNKCCSQLKTQPLISFKIVQWICWTCKMYLSILSNIFVYFAKCFWPNYQMYFSNRQILLTTKLQHLVSFHHQCNYHVNLNEHKVLLGYIFSSAWSVMIWDELGNLIYNLHLLSLHRTLLWNRTSLLDKGSCQKTDILLPGWLKGWGVAGGHGTKDFIGKE